MQTDTNKMNAVTWLPLVMALAAATSESLATWKSGDSQWWLIAETLAQIGVTLIVAIGLQRRFGQSSQPPIVAPLAVALSLVSVMLEPVWRMGGIGRAGEVILLDGLKFATLCMAVVVRWPQFARATVGMSLFLQLFAAAITNATVVHCLTAIFVVMAIVWNSASYWSQLKPRLLSHVGNQVHRYPFLVAGLAGLALFVLAAPLEHVPLLRSLRGMAPTSGAVGGEQYDPFARDGVGEGDAAIAGKDHIRSFAPIDDAPFVSIEQPSLYDVFDEQYGEPAGNQKVERAIALTTDQVVQQRCQKLTQVNEVGREFSIQRRGPSRSTSTARESKPALMHVVGRTPLHLRMEVFDVFDGLRWHTDATKPKRPQPLELAHVDGRSWVRPPQRAESINIFRGRESHALKIINLDSNRVPSPPHLTGIHISKIDDASLFRWAQPSIVRLDRQRIPPLSVIHVASETVDWSFIPHSYLRAAWVNDAYSQFPEVVDRSRVEQLARSWTEGTSYGWPQVVAVANRLRADYKLDQIGTDDLSETTAAEQFLFESRRGPDYQFATAASLLLRSLGYSTRLVRGFYVSPDKYDARLGHTPVDRHDAHFWLEVYMGAEMWVSVDPSPGYELLGPPPTAFEQLQAIAGALGAFAHRQWQVLVALAVAGTVVYRNRVWLRDIGRTLAWRMFHAQQARRTLSRAAQLIDDRCRWVGLPRPPGVTLRRWLPAITAAVEEPQPTQFERFMELVDWAAFGSMNRNLPTPKVLRISQEMLDHYSLQRLTMCRAQRELAGKVSSVSIAANSTLSTHEV